EAKRVKEVVHRLGLPPLPDVLRAFIGWVAGYTLQPPGAVLRMALNAARRWKTPEPVRAISAAGPALQTLGIKPTPAREKVLAVAARKTFPTAAALAKSAKVGSGVVSDLIKTGALKVAEQSPPPLFDPPDVNAAPPRLE